MKILKYSTIVGNKLHRQQAEPHQMTRGSALYLYRNFGGKDKKHYICLNLFRRNTSKQTL